jgi:hypothetical protein
MPVVTASTTVTIVIPMIIQRAVKVDLILLIESAFSATFKPSRMLKKNLIFGTN